MLERKKERKIQKMINDKTITLKRKKQRMRERLE